MSDASWPLMNRGPEALQEMLRGDIGARDASLRLLTRTELRSLAVAADLLATAARGLIETTWPVMASREPAMCDNPSPHAEHEWYGRPAALRIVCPGRELPEWERELLERQVANETSATPAVAGAPEAPPKDQKRIEEDR